MIKVFFPKINCRSEIRGIGFYTQFLIQNLQLLSQFKLVASAKEADIVHYTFFDFYFPTLKIYPLKKNLVTIHDTIPLIFKKQYPCGVRGFFNFLKQKNNLRKVDHFITDSFHSAQDLHRYLKIKKNKITTTYLAGNPHLKIPTKNEIQLIEQRFHLPKKYLLYVGDINYNKNLISLILALKLVDSEIKLIFVGNNFRSQEIPEWRFIIQAINKNHLQSRVLFINNIEKNDWSALSVLYNQAIAYIQPSLYEGFGLPMLEAWQCGNLVIAGFNSSLKEIGREIAFLTKEDSQSLATMITSVINLTPLERQKKLIQTQKYLNNFSWEKTAQETFEIYRQVLLK